MPIDAEALVAAESVCVEFAGREVLHDVSLAVRPGRIVTVIGPNGSGKSTLVRTLLGLQPPTRGTVRRRPGLRIGFMPQFLAIDRDLPMTPRRFLALSGVRDRRRIEAALDEVGAAYTADRPIQVLSGGEFQRVLLARALLRAPDLLVLDEPVRSVDVTGQAELYDLIGAIRDRHGCGVLMVSHDLHLVMAATDEVICLNGHVCCAGTPEAVSRHPEYFALFGPTIAASLAVYTHAHDHTHDAAGHVLAADGEGHAVAVPPEHGHAHDHAHDHAHGHVHERRDRAHG